MLTKLSVSDDGDEEERLGVAADAAGDVRTDGGSAYRCEPARYPRRRTSQGRILLNVKRRLQLEQQVIDPGLQPRKQSERL
jgi:hypothetical protein